MIKRRQLLRRGLQSAVSLSMLGSVPMGLMSSLRAQATEDYRATVCVLLAGGADSFNLLVPRSNQAYSQYRQRRSDLALAQSDLLPLDGEHNGVAFGVHPALGNIQRLFNNGSGTFVSNIGPLVEPTTRAALEAESVTLPLGLFSHSDQILSWQTATPANRAGTGFGGRLIDALASANTGVSLAGNISLSGNNAFQAGAAVGSYSLNAAAGVRTIAGYDNNIFQGALDRLLTDSNAPALQRVYADKIQSAIDVGGLFSNALEQAVSFSTSFSEDPFSLAMKRIAELISVRDLLGMARQTFFVTYGGWDHHEDTLGQQAAMLPALDAGLGQFVAALSEIGMGSQVTTYTISDFGRTLTSNGKGSDHGWGGNVMALGGSINGGRLYGEFPELVEDNPLDLGRGRFLPTTASDALFADIARWMGVADTDMATVLPNWPGLADSPQGQGIEGLLKNA